MENWSIIRRLALSLGASSVAITKWRQRGIPPAWAFRLLERARVEGESLSEADIRPLLSTTSDSQAA